MGCVYLVGFVVEQSGVGENKETTLPRANGEAHLQHPSRLHTVMNRLTCRDLCKERREEREGKGEREKESESERGKEEKD